MTNDIRTDISSKTCARGEGASGPSSSTRLNAKVQVFSAVAMLIAGVALAVAGFIVPPTGEISDSVLMFTAQCLVYAGSALGINVYINSKFSDIKRQLTSNKGEEGTSP